MRAGGLDASEQDRAVAVEIARGDAVAGTWEAQPGTQSRVVQA
jgi:hypothetical protein